MNRDVSLRLLRYYEALASELNYRKAAERLFISQPALSAAIRQLEGYVGDRLFDRDTHSVALTAVGREWLPYVREALREVDSAIDVVATLVGNAQIRLGYLTGMGADLLFELLDGVEQDLAGLSIETTEYDFSDPTAGLGSVPPTSRSCAPQWTWPISRWWWSPRSPGSPAFPAPTASPTAPSCISVSSWTSR